MWTLMKTLIELVEAYLQGKPIGKILCPKCRKHGYLSVEPRGNHYYVYIKHKDFNKQYKCYLGAVAYDYVNRYNKLGLEDALTCERHINYAIESIRNIISVLKEKRDLRGFYYENINKQYIAQKLAELKQLVSELEQLLNQ